MIYCSKCRSSERGPDLGVGNSSGTSKSNKKHVRCHHCSKFSHYMSVCPKLKMEEVSFSNVVSFAKNSNNSDIVIAASDSNGLRLYIRYVSQEKLVRYLWISQQQFHFGQE